MNQTSRRTTWKRRMLEALSAAIGARVTAATVREMAFFEDPPVFIDARLPFVQAQVVELRLGERGYVSVSTCMDKDEFSLDVRSASAALAVERDDPSSIFRTRAMAEFPSGEIEDAEWRVDERGRIQEISLRIDDRPVFLRAGEVEECQGRGAIIRDYDESVLIFLSREAYAATRFNVPL